MNRAIITRINNNTVFAYMKGETAYDIIVEDEKEMRVGDVYVGCVKNVVDNIRAAFVEIGDGINGFLPIRSEDKKSVRPGRMIVVQIKKPAFQNKDVTLSTRIEIAGRYLVFLDPGDSQCVDDDQKIRVSRKIGDTETIERLTNLINETAGDFADNLRITIRTNAAVADDKDILNEHQRIFDIFKNILDHGDKRTTGTCLYKNPPGYIRKLNSYPEDELHRIVTDRQDIYDVLMPEFGPEILTFYEDTSYPLDMRYGISTTLKKAQDRRVWLKSGANLIIDRTEAMTVIDINSAKAIEGKRASETTFSRINMEAATEIARQMRLRNLGGIILVDFIDMKKKENIDALTKHLRKLLAEDPVKAVFVDFTKLGIAEITRARQA